MNPDQPEADESELRRGDLIALVGTTTRVFEDCRMANGALIEAPSHVPSYPPGARSGLFCRPGRELPMAILAMETLGRDVRPILLPWLLNHAESFSETGILFGLYEVSGSALVPTPDTRGMTFLMHAVSRWPEVDGSRAVLDRLERGFQLLWEDEPPPSVDGDRYLTWLNVAGALRDCGSAFAKPLIDSIEHELDCGDMPLDVNLRLIDFASFEELGGTIDSPLIWRRFFWIASLASPLTNRNGQLREFFETMALSDRDCHFRETVYRDPQTPSPYLLSHLTFLLAAGRTGELAKIPKSGSTGKGRTSS